MFGSARFRSTSEAFVEQLTDPGLELNAQPIDIQLLVLKYNLIFNLNYLRRTVRTRGRPVALNRHRARVRARTELAKDRRFLLRIVGAEAIAVPTP